MTRSIDRIAAPGQERVGRLTADQEQMTREIAKLQDRPARVPFPRSSRAPTLRYKPPTTLSSGRSSGDKVGRVPNATPQPRRTHRPAIGAWVCLWAGTAFSRAVNTGAEQNSELR
jgi:hypothetical protein